MIRVFLKNAVFFIAVCVLTVETSPRLTLRSQLEVYDSILHEIEDVTRHLESIRDLNNDEEPDLSKSKYLAERQMSVTSGSDGSTTFGGNVPLPGGSVSGSLTVDHSGHLSGGSLGGTIGEGVQGSGSISYDKDKGLGGSVGIGLGAGGYGTDTHVGWNAKDGFSTGVGAKAGPVGMSVDTNGHSTSSSLGITAGGSSSHTPSHSSGGFFHDLFGKRDSLYDTLNEDDIEELFERQVSISTGSDGSHTLGVNAPFPGGSIGGSITTDKNGHVSGGSVGGSIGEGVQGSGSISYDKDKGLGGSVGLGLGAGGYGTDAHVGWNAKDGFSTGVGAKAGPVGMSVDTNGHSTSSSLGITAGGSSSHTPSHSSGGFFHDLFGKRDSLYDTSSEDDIKDLFDRQVAITTGSDGSHTVAGTVPLPGGSISVSVTTDKTGHLTGGSVGGTVGEGIQGSGSVSYDKDKGYGASVGIGYGVGGSGVDFHESVNQKDGFSSGVSTNIGPVSHSVDTDGKTVSSSTSITASVSHTPTHSSSGSSSHSSSHSSSGSSSHSSSHSSSGSSSHTSHSSSGSGSHIIHSISHFFHDHFGKRQLLSKY